jgi:hypothetical protein
MVPHQKTRRFMVLEYYPRIWGCFHLSDSHNTLPIQLAVYLDPSFDAQSASTVGHTLCRWLFDGLAALA